MGRKFIGLLFIFVFAGARLVSTAQEPVPGASSYLAGTAESFLASCRSDVEDGKKRIGALKASQPPRDAVTTLQAFDTALVVVVDAENRAGLAEQVHPSKPFRDAAQTCEQEVTRVLSGSGRLADGDLLLALGGTPVQSSADVGAYQRQEHTGTQVMYTLVRPERF